MTQVYKVTQTPIHKIIEKMYGHVVLENACVGCRWLRGMCVFV